jgi:two-component system OmpR family response regulator
LETWFPADLLISTAQPILDEAIMLQPAPHILVLEDEGITGPLCEYLMRFGFETHGARIGSDIRQHCDSHPVDLVVLDLTLPGVEGVLAARSARARVPVIMLTAHCSAAERIVGLEMGADDCLSKPFEPRELVARIRALLRRADSRQGAAPACAKHGEVIHFDGWALQRNERQLTSPKGMLVPLSNAEYQLLSTFLKAPRRVVSRDHLMEQARGRTMDPLDRSIDLLVSRLRQKLLDDTGAAALIKTVRGAGYVFDAKSVQEAPTWRH